MSVPSSQSDPRAERDPDAKDGQPQRGVDVVYVADGSLPGRLDPRRGGTRMGSNLLLSSCLLRGH